MSDEKRLSLSFGDFRCEAVGYDRPREVLNHIIDRICEAVAEGVWPASGADIDTEALKARLAPPAAGGARELGAVLETDGGRLTITRADAVPSDAAAVRAGEAADHPARRAAPESGETGRGADHAAAPPATRPRARIVRTARKTPTPADADAPFVMADNFVFADNALPAVAPSAAGDAPSRRDARSGDDALLLTPEHAAARPDDRAVAADAAQGEEAALHRPRDTHRAAPPRPLGPSGAKGGPAWLQTLKRAAKRGS